MFYIHTRWCAWVMNTSINHLDERYERKNKIEKGEILFIKTVMVITKGAVKRGDHRTKGGRHVVQEHQTGGYYWIFYVCFIWNIREDIKNKPLVIPKEEAPKEQDAAEVPPKEEEPNHIRNKPQKQ
eukprot:218710_1